MRDNSSVDRERASAESDNELAPAPKGGAQAQAGQAAVGRMLHLTGAELAKELTHAQPSQVGAILDGAETSGQLAAAVKQLTATQSQHVLQPALQSIADDPLTTLRKEMLDTVFNNTPDGYNVTLMVAFKLRFGLQRVGLQKGEGGKIWDTQGLRRAWRVLATLPEAQVLRRPELLGIERQKGMSGGVYDPNKDEIDLEPTEKKQDIYKSVSSEGGTDALDHVNFFDSMVRHEVGHSVDARINASGTYCTTSDGGGWHVYQSPAEILTALYTAHGVTLPSIAAPAAPQALDPSSPAPTGQTSAAPAPAPQTTDDAASAVWTALSAYISTYDPSVLKDVKAALARVQDPTEHEALAAVEASVATGIKEGSTPWWLPDGGSVHLGDRTYFFDQQMGSWSSYLTAARDKRVSTYQFRSPFEWFAECYAAYYDPESNNKGAMLAAHDTTTKGWFDENVAKLQSDTAMKPGGTHAGAKT